MDGRATDARFPEAIGHSPGRAWHYLGRRGGREPVSKSPKYCHVRLAAERERQLADKRRVDDQRRIDEAARRAAQQDRTPVALDSARRLVATAKEHGYATEAVARLSSCVLQLSNASQPRVGLDQLMNLEANTVAVQGLLSNWLDKVERRGILVSELCAALLQVGYFVDQPCLRKASDAALLGTVIVPARRGSGDELDVLLSEDGDGAERISYHRSGLLVDGALDGERCESTISLTNRIRMLLQKQGVEATAVTWEDDDRETLKDVLPPSASTRASRMSHESG